MPDSFGTRLRKRREEQAIALATIVEQTKIKRSLLEALERDDVSHWPTGIFRRAYVRAYAEAIGLNPDTAVREFLEVHPEPREVVETLSAIASASHPVRPDAGPPSRLRSALSSALSSVSRLRRTPDVVPPPTRPPEPADAVEEPGGPGDAGELVSGAVPEQRSPTTIDLPALADLCTELGRIETASELLALLQDASRILGAAGLIVWTWDETSGELLPVLSQGYSDRVLAHLPPVKRDSDNATAAAFRSGQTCAINGTEDTCGALAVPLLTPAGCTAVLALELQHRGEQNLSVRAAATILAAVLAQLVGGAARRAEESAGQ